MRDTFNVGDRVLTVFGEGTVLGIEMFTRDGKSFLCVEGPWVKERDDKKVTRAVVRLAEGHTWSFKNQNCYEWLTSLTWID